MPNPRVPDNDVDALLGSQGPQMFAALMNALSSGAGGFAQGQRVNREQAHRERTTAANQSLRERTLAANQQNRATTAASTEEHRRRLEAMRQVSMILKLAGPEAARGAVSGNPSMFPGLSLPPGAETDPERMMRLGGLDSPEGLEGSDLGMFNLLQNLPPQTRAGLALGMPNPPQPHRPREFAPQNPLYDLQRRYMASKNPAEREQLLQDMRTIAGVIAQTRMSPFQQQYMDDERDVGAPSVAPPGGAVDSEAKQAIHGILAEMAQGNMGRADEARQIAGQLFPNQPEKLKQALAIIDQVQRGEPIPIPGQ